MKFQMNLKLIFVLLLAFASCFVQSKSVKKQSKSSRPKSRFDTENGSGGRDKREGFVDLDVLPHAMRGFANNIGKGFSSMIHRGNSLGQKMAGLGHSIVNPTVYYGNWKPIYPSDPNYSKPHNSYNSVKETYRPVSDYRPPASSYQEPEYHNSLPVQNYEQVHVPELNYGSFKPISSSYEPVSTYSPIQPFSEPEIDSYGSPAAPPIYETVKPIYEQPAVVTYGPPISTYDPIAPTVSTYEPPQSVYEPEQETYGTPIASPINTFIPTSNPVNPFTSPVAPTSSNLVDFNNTPLVPPVRTSSPVLSPLPNDPYFIDTVLENSIFRHDVEKNRPVRFSR